MCDLPFNDFPLTVGSGYFIRSNLPSTWTIEGYEVTEAVSLTLQVGWNSIAIPHSDAYMASSLCDDIIGQGVSAVEIDRWHHAGWEGHICGLPFNDFPIERNRGYFIKSNSSGTVIPTAPALVRQPKKEMPATPKAVSTDHAVPIHNLQVSNLRDTSVTLSWTTQEASTGYVYFGESGSKRQPLPRPKQVAYDRRGATIRSTTHVVVLNNLMPETTYYFEIISGAEVEAPDQEPYTVTTLSPLDNVPPSDSIYGQVYQADGITPATGSLVYLLVHDGDDVGSAGEASLISALVDEQGYWYANLGNARLTEGSERFAYSMQGDRVIVTAQSGVADAVTHTFDTGELRPAQPLTLQAQEGSPLYLPLIKK